MGRWVAALIASSLMLLVGPAASAWGDAKVRFVQTIPGAGAVELHATAERHRPADRPRRSGSARSAATRTCPPERSSSSSSSADGTVLSDGAASRSATGAHYTVVAMRDDSALHGAPGRRAPTAAPSRLRAVQAAPELGSGRRRLGDEPVAEGIGFGDVAPYTPVAPGAYALQVTSPKDGSMIASRGAVTLTAGTSSTAFVIGTRRRAGRATVAADRTAAPRGAPATGLGGLADEDSAAAPRPARGLPGAPSPAPPLYVALTARSRRGGF